MAKATKPDKATTEVLKRMLAMPPKQHDEMKVVRTVKKNRDPKGRASSAKRRDA